MVNLLHNRLLLYLLLFQFVVSCNSKKEAGRFLPKEYAFPLEQIGDGKTFVYGNVDDSSQTSMMDLELITESGTQFLLSKQYSGDFVFESSKSTVDGKLIESTNYLIGHNFFGGNLPVKGIIQENKIIENTSKYGQQAIKVKYRHGDITATINSTEVYLKDTVLTWKGKSLNCIVTRLNCTIEFSDKTGSYSKQKLSYSGKFYFAKKYGLIRYTIKNKDGFSRWELLEIKNKK